MDKAATTSGRHGGHRDELRVPDAVNGSRGLTTVHRDGSAEAGSQLLFDPGDRRGRRAVRLVPGPPQRRRVVATARRWAPKAALVVADAAMVVVGLWLAYRLRWLLPNSSAREANADYELIALLAVPLWLAVMARYHLYSARHVQPVAGELNRLLHAGALAAASTTFVAFMLNQDNLSRGWLALSFVCCTALLVVERAGARAVFDRLRRSGRLARLVLLVGVDEHGAALAHAFSTRPRLGYRIAGLVDDELPAGTVVRGGPRVVGTVEETCSLVAAAGVDGVILSTTAFAPARLNALTRKLADTGIHVELSSPLQGIAPERLMVRSLGDQFTVVHVRPRRHTRRRAAAKRVFDVVTAAFGLVVSAPLLAVLAVVVKLDSPGPVLFRQLRVGRGGSTFRLLKLRSMVVDAEERLESLRHLNEAAGPLFKLRSDPRITRVGRLIRCLSLDELPQLWNVLRGDMSLVGPRPALPSELTGWTPELHDRLKVRPGITGMWQVNGRADATFDDYVHLDLYYVDNWSLPLDIKILLRTIPTVLCQRGAR